MKDERSLEAPGCARLPVLAKLLYASTGCKVNSEFQTAEAEMCVRPTLLK